MNAPTPFHPTVNTDFLSFPSFPASDRASKHSGGEISGDGSPCFSTLGVRVGWGGVWTKAESSNTSWPIVWAACFFLSWLHSKQNLPLFSPSSQLTQWWYILQRKENEEEWVPPHSESCCFFWKLLHFPPLAVISPSVGLQGALLDVMHFQIRPQPEDSVPGSSLGQRVV